ncbi:MAG: hypothetical protein K8F53_00305 [Rhodocyclaceae bacterium]|nr:hypothetical protein [Rhodocyclaceae bacterium]
MPPLDPFAGLLSELIKSGRVPRSRIGKPARRRLKPLFAAEALKEERSGAGAVVVVRNREVLVAFAARCYPGGLDQPASPSDAGPRAASLMAYGDTKASGEGLDREIVLIRAFGAATGTILGRTVELGAVTREMGCAAFVLSEKDRPGFEGVMALIEGPEVFLDFERTGIKADIVILYNGRISNRMIEWLASPEMAKASFLHCPDYDPVGLDEFARVERALGDRIRLYIPEKIEELFAASRNVKIIEDNAAIKYRLAAHPNVGIQNVLRLIDRYGVGLEQEVLLLSY